jgi:hypothetical protein
LDLIELNSRLSLADAVEIIDMSFGGVALKVDRRLNIGRECMMKFGNRGSSIDVQATVVRSRLSGMEDGIHGERVPVYTAAMRFEEGVEGRIADFIREAILA